MQISSANAEELRLLGREKDGEVREIEMKKKTKRMVSI